MRCFAFAALFLILFGAPRSYAETSIRGDHPRMYITKETIPEI